MNKKTNYHQEIIKSEIYEYNPTDVWLQDTTQPYSGYISIVENDVINLNAVFSRAGNNCVVGATGYWECSWGNKGDDHAPGECDGDYSNYIIELEYGPCSDDTNDGHVYIAGDEEVGDGSFPSGGGGNNTNNDNQSNTNDAADNNTPVIPMEPTLKEEILNCINGGLVLLGSDNPSYIDPEIINQLRLPETQWTAINNYLQDSGCMKEAREFAIAALDAIENGGEVDFDDNLILSAEFKNNEKLKCVYDKLAGDNSNLFNDTVGAFVGNRDVNLILTIGDCTDPAGACTQTQYVAETGIITIKIENINETPIEIAQMILHEAIHAELAKYVLEHDSSVDTDDKPRLFELYKFYRESGVSETHIDHPYMALNYIDPIASTLRQFDNNQYPLDHYKSLAWIGLERFDVNSVLTEPLINSYSQYLSTIIQNSTTCN